jgi:uncharacterized protein YidB (DUF937 family)
MDIIALGTQLLSDKLGVDVDSATISSALTSLLSNSEGQVDIAGLVSKFSGSGDIGSALQSWLGDGANSGISADAIGQIFGNSQLSSFASQLGTNTETAASGLAEVIPQLIDKASSGGELLESVGGIGGLMNAASSLFK